MYHVKTVVHVLVLTAVNVRNNNKILISIIIIIIFEGANGYTGDYCQQRMFNCVKIDIIIINIFLAICLPAVGNDSLSYQAPSGICENGGTCISPNLCQVSVYTGKPLLELFSIMVSLQCTASWNGTYCQIPICNPSCINSGNCTNPNVCTCNTALWNGSICQTRI
jgi:hypothetical protein